MTSGVSEMNHICVMRLSKSSESNRQDREEISKQLLSSLLSALTEPCRKVRGKERLINFGRSEASWRKQTWINPFGGGGRTFTGQHGRWGEQRQFQVEEQLEQKKVGHWQKAEHVWGWWVIPCDWGLRDLQGMIVEVLEQQAKQLRVKTHPPLGYVPPTLRRGSCEPAGLQENCSFCPLFCECPTSPTGLSSHITYLEAFTAFLLVISSVSPLSTLIWDS